MVIDLLWFTKRNTRQILHCKTFKKLSILYFWLKSLWDVFLLWRLPCMIPGLVSSTLVCGYLCSSFREFGGLGVWWNRQRISLFWIVRKQLSFDFPHTFYCISFSPSSSSSNSFFMSLSFGTDTITAVQLLFMSSLIATNHSSA